MKSLYKSLTAWFLCLVFVFSNFTVSFADVKSLMIGTSSNALMTLELDDSDYAVMPMSSMGAVTNTVSSNSLIMNAWVTDQDGSNGYTETFTAYKGTNGRYTYSLTVPDGKYISNIAVVLFGSDMPPSGAYSFGFDLTSHISYTPTSFYLYTLKRTDNALTIASSLYPSYSSDSGDIYVPSYDFNLTNIYSMSITIGIPRKTRIGVVGGSFAINFTPISGGEYPSTGGTDTSTQDYQNDVSSSLSDLSSSVNSMTEDLNSAAQNLEYISTSQNLIIQGIDNVIMHISDQLYAFWDQLFNLIHLPTMAKMDDIITAINNMDLEIEVNLDGLKQSIQQASQNEIANDNKISADQIANDEANTEEVKDAVKEHGNFIIDGLKGLFIPSDEFFKAYFDDLYLYFSDRFGFLSFPIDLLVRTVNLFINSSDVDAVLTLPSFEISGEQVWADQSFNFTEFLETNFAFLLAAIRTVTSIGMIYAFVNLCQDKWDEVMKS